MHITQLITEQLGQVVADLQLSVPAQLHLEHPANPDHGDYASNIAMTLFAQLSKEKSDYNNPRELANTIVERLQMVDAQSKFAQAISEISVAGPGFINFRLSQAFLVSKIGEVIAKQGMTAKKIGSGKTVVVEYSSPNIAKPFTIGHLRSTLIGDAVANLLDAVGYDVKRDNHLGDWGTQFGKQIYAIKNFIPDESKIESAENPVKELVNLYVKFHEEAEKNPEIVDEARGWFKKLEDGDQEARRLWQKCIDWSWVEFKKVYDRLGIEFTENDGHGYGESFFEDKMIAVINELRQKELLTESEGAELVFFPNDVFPPAMILKKDGSTLYATRDLATDRFRLDTYGKDVIIINEVGAEQALYFRQLYKMEEMLGWVKPGQRVHVKHGLYRFKDKKMSTRKGNVIWLEEVLDEAERRAFYLASSKHDIEYNSGGVSTNRKDGNSPSLNIGVMGEVAQAVGIGALKWNDLKRSSHLDVVFDWDEILNLTGNSGPYLQYTYVRCHSLLQKATATASTEGKVETVRNSDITNYIDILLNNKSYLEHKSNIEEIDLLRNLYKYSEVVELAAQEYAPHHLCTYLYSLAQSFNTFYGKHAILPESAESIAIAEFRLLLTSAVSQILSSGLAILGIDTVEKM